MANITLRPITNQNFKEVIQLKVNEDETKFVAPNAYSIAQAYVEHGAYPMAIYADEKPVGFTMYGQFEEDEGDYWIARLMVDKNHRRQGYGEAAMRIAIDEMRRNEDCEKIFVSFVPGNVDAQLLYEKLGFLDTGMIVDGELVYVIKFGSY